MKTDSTMPMWNSSEEYFIQISQYWHATKKKKGEIEIFTLLDQMANGLFSFVSCQCIDND